jgi:hypothetical protein
LRIGEAVAEKETEHLAGDGVVVELTSGGPFVLGGAVGCLRQRIA